MVSDTAFHSLILIPSLASNNSTSSTNQTQLEYLIVVTNSYQAHMITIQGKVIKTFSSGKMTGGDFVCATLSPQGTGNVT